MKTWKLVSGILSIVLFFMVAFQSCAAGISNSLSETGEVSGSAGKAPLLLCFLPEALYLLQLAKVAKVEILRLLFYLVSLLFLAIH